jgi:hypothetical protein
MNTVQKVIKVKLGLLELAKELVRNNIDNWQ